MMKSLRYQLACLLIAVCGSTLAQTSWVKTDASSLATGDVVAIVDLNSGCAMTNNNAASKAPAAQAVTLSDDQEQLEGEVAENVQWVVTVSDGKYQFQVAETDNYLYATNANNGLRVGTNENNVFTIAQNDGKDYLVNSATTRYVGVYNDKNNGPQDWRCYTTINDNIKTTVTAFFKQTTGGQQTTKTAKPTLTPNGGTFTEPVEVTFGHADEEAMIFYTVNSEDWNTAQAVEPGESITLSENTVLRVKAHDGENEFSDVVTATYTFISKITIAEAQTQAAGSTVLVEGTVVAAGATGAVLSDGTDQLYYYNNKNDLTVGQKVRAMGALTSYGGALQLTNTATITQLGTETVTYPEPVVLNGTLLDEIKAGGATRKYVEVEGLLAISGNYFNVTVEGAETSVASFIKPTFDVSDLNGKTIVVKGYCMYVSSKYVYIIATSIEEKVADGIESLNAQPADAAAYNLRGQRVATPSKGLYIVGGKKVLFK